MCNVKKLHSAMSLPYIKILIKTNMELCSRVTGFFHALSALNPHRGISVTFRRSDRLENGDTVF